MAQLSKKTAHVKILALKNIIVAHLLLQKFKHEHFSYVSFSTQDLRYAHEIPCEHEHVCIWLQTKQGTFHAYLVSRG